MCVDLVLARKAIFKTFLLAPLGIFDKTSGFHLDNPRGHNATHVLLIVESMKINFSQLMN